MLSCIFYVQCGLQAHLAPINALVVSPDGKMLVTTAMDKYVNANCLCTYLFNFNF